MLDRKTGELHIVLTRCHQWACPHCAPIRLAQVKDKARRGHPERHIVLTCRPMPGWSQAYHVKYIRKKVRILVQAIRREFGHFEYMMALELHKNGAPHVHILQRGTYISQRWLSTHWFKLTGNFKVHIGGIHRTEGAIAELTKYLAKTAALLGEILPGLAVFTTSKGWLIDPPERSPEYAERDWFAVYHPSKTSDLLAAAAALGTSVKPSGSCPGTYQIIPSDSRSLQEALRLAGQHSDEARQLVLMIDCALRCPQEFEASYGPYRPTDDLPDEPPVVTEPRTSAAPSRGDQTRLQAAQHH